ncbi:hypothetical protein [Chitinophaga sp. sic0106]|uniref:hypothetical protein n=1 Tax=Chitinophaga sp. sic0106 TaxID=2854785 RepID=UPI001C43B03C|nr:hypothetical protein [Chitinophaga sp. sic0106]MBV7534059.1 hypothetical protein [Chitinophaga sp. sic0106]
MNTKEVAAFEGIPVAQAYDLSVINYLNDLAYLKDKAKYDKLLHDQWQRKHNGNRL